MTEGSFYRSIDILTNPTKISADLVIGNTDDLPSVLFKKCSPLCIFLSIAIPVMLNAVQFDHKIRFRTVKGRNIFPSAFCLKKRTG